MKNNKKKVCTYIILILIIVSGIGIHNYNTKFTTKKWTKISNLDGRIKWIDDLEKKYTIIGMNSDEITELLGNPELKISADKTKQYYDFSKEGADEYWGYEVKDDILVGWKMYLLGFKDGKVVGKKIIIEAL